MGKPAWSTKQAAKALGLRSALDVTAMIVRGEIPATKAGRMYQIADADLQAVLAARAGFTDTEAAARRIRELEAEVALLTDIVAGPSTDAARGRQRVIRVEYELAHGRRQRTKITKRLRWMILERDGHRCVYCGATPDVARLVIDHILPRIDGGTEDPANLVTACADCNDGKADRPLIGPLPAHTSV